MDSGFMLALLDDDINERDVFFYKYPAYDKLKAVGINSVYLGHYLHWYGRMNYENSQGAWVCGPRERSAIR